jgi:hypothetical protein
MTPADRVKYEPSFEVNGCQSDLCERKWKMPLAKMSHDAPVYDEGVWVGVTYLDGIQICLASEGLVRYALGPVKIVLSKVCKLPG